MKHLQRRLILFILVYLDDILVYSRSVEEHWDQLKRALERLRQTKLYGRLHKCEFLKHKVDYLGFEVSAEGVNASPEKVKAILDWPRPQTVHDIHSFFGFGFILPQIYTGILADWQNR